MTDWMIIVGILIVMVSPGIYYSWKTRHHGKFKIMCMVQPTCAPFECRYSLWYNHRGEWIFDSDHDYKKEAEDKIKVYQLRKSDRRSWLARTIWCLWKP